LLLDLIMSPETQFLVYVVRVLKYMAASWNDWTDVCRDYALNVCQSKQDGAVNVSAVCLEHEKRKYSNVGLREQETLSLYNDDDSLGSVVTADKQTASVPCSLLTTEQVSRHTAVEKRALVDYSSSSDDEDVSSKSRVCDKLTKKQRVDLSASDYDQREQRMLLSGGDGALTGDSSCSTLERAMTVLCELRRVICRLVARNVFPFNVQPLIRHLRHCQVLYRADVV